MKKYTISTLNAEDTAMVIRLAKLGHFISYKPEDLNIFQSEDYDSYKYDAKRRHGSNFQLVYYDAEEMIITYTYKKHGEFIRVFETMSGTLEVHHEM